MELEIKCQDCNFKTIVDWPEYKAKDGEVLLDSELCGESSLSTHHKSTRPTLVEYKGIVSGHSYFKLLIIRRNIT